MNATRKLFLLSTYENNVQNMLVSTHHVPIINIIKQLNILKIPVAVVKAFERDLYLYPGQLIRLFKF